MALEFQIAAFPLNLSMQMVSGSFFGRSNGMLLDLEGWNHSGPMSYAEMDKPSRDSHRKSDDIPCRRTCICRK